MRVGSQFFLIFVNVYKVENVNVVGARPLNWRVNKYVFPVVFIIDFLTLDLQKIWQIILENKQSDLFWKLQQGHVNNFCQAKQNKNPTNICPLNEKTNILKKQNKVYCKNNFIRIS